MRRSLAVGFLIWEQLFVVGTGHASYQLWSWINHLSRLIHKWGRKVPTLEHCPRDPMESMQQFPQVLTSEKSADGASPPPQSESWEGAVFAGLKRRIVSSPRDFRSDASTGDSV